MTSTYQSRGILQSACLRLEERKDLSTQIIRDGGWPRQQAILTKQIRELKVGLSCSCQQLVSALEVTQNTWFLLDRPIGLDRAFSVAAAVAVVQL